MSQYIYEGLGILLKYEPKGNLCGGPHLVFFISHTQPYEKLVSEEDATKLEALEWYWDDDENCWSSGA